MLGLLITALEIIAAILKWGLIGIIIGASCCFFGHQLDRRWLRVVGWLLIGIGAIGWIGVWFLFN